MFDWKLLFDRIYCIHFLPYHSRYETCKKTLLDNGILNSGIFEWNFTAENKLYDLLYQKMLNMKLIFQMSEVESSATHTEGYIKNKNVFNLAINALNLILQAYLLGYERILIAEDDLAFLKDKLLICEYLNNYPTDYDIVSMEYWFRNNNDYSYATTLNRRINDYYCFLAKERLVNFSFVGLSRKGMRHIIDGMNQHFINSDYYIANLETYDDWKIKRAISRIPLCVQAVNNESNHTAQLNDMKWKYDKIKLDLSNYEGY